MGEDGALLGPAELKALTLIEHFERTQQAELHARTIGRWLPEGNTQFGDFQRSSSVAPRAFQRVV